MSVLGKLRSLSLKKKLDAEMREEMRLHIELQTERNLKAGMSPEEARYAALRQFGNVASLQERAREQRGWVWLEAWMRDVRFGARSLLKSPGFTAVAVLTLALGLAVNTSVFGLINEMMLRPLAVRAPGELAFIMRRNPQMLNMPFQLSYADFLDMRAQVAGSDPGDTAVRSVFADLIAYATHPAHVSEDGGRAERTWVHEVSDNYFEMLGVRASFGRLFNPTEGVRPNADPIIVLSHDTWVRRFGGDRGIIGRKLLLNGAPFTVIGVTPEGFGGAEAIVQAGFFVPAMMADQLRPHETGAIAARGNTSHMVMARLQPDATMGQAQAAADAMLQRLIAAHPGVHPPATAVVIPESQSRPSPYVSQFTAPALGALMLLGALVLVVAAANVANLLYARAADAERSLAIRSSLGATRGRLIRQLLVESLLIALAAAAVGWVASQWFGVLLEQTGTSADNPPPAAPGVSWLPFVFTLIAALATGIAAGLFPAWRASRLDVLALLKGATSTGTRTRHPFRTLLVGGQIVVACIVLMCAGLALRSLQSLSGAELGFRPDNILLATFDLEMQRYSHPRTENFQRELLARVRALPGVIDAALSRSVPFDRTFGMRDGIGAEGYVSEPNELFPIGCVPVSDRFIEAMRIPLLAGRTFVESDDAKAPAVAIISRSVAQHFWPDQDPLGRRLAFGGGRRLIEVIGVVGEMRYMMMTESPRPVIFLPVAQEPSPRATLVVRTEKSPMLLGSGIAEIARRLDAGLPVHNLTTFDDHIATSPLGLMVLRMGTMIAGTQGLLVLLLSVMGIYALVAFAVTRRTREIGIRVALGASKGDVFRLVTRPSVTLTAVSLGIGLAVSALISRPLAAVLYGAGTIDFAVMAAVAVLLLAVTVLACWLPARRAAKVDPMVALHAE